MKDKVRAKKHLGQHFLKEPAIAARVAEALVLKEKEEFVLEIGPGMGILTRFLLAVPVVHLKVVEIDPESVEYLTKHYPALVGNIIEGDFLKLTLPGLFPAPFSVIGNFPYNISSQILFHALDNRRCVKTIVGMFQREVAQRITSPPGSRDYGILSVLLQAFYHCEYLFTVNEEAFQPPPKVKSGVVRLLRKENFELGCDEHLFREVVKTAFNQRRKTLRNALGGLAGRMNIRTAEIPFGDKRAEQLPWEDFRVLTLLFQGKITPSQSGQ